MSFADEIPIENEDYYAGQIADRFMETLSKYYQSGITKRMFHPKMHGLVLADFIIEPNLPEHLKTGLFAEPKTYPAWVRLSNAKRHAAKDNKKDMRGMAIKIVGVPGYKLLENGKDTLTQDFLLVTAETLQTVSVKDFKKSIYALTGGFFKLFFYSLFHLKVIIRSIRQIAKCSNLLEQTYFSMTPYLYGKNNAVKYACFPQKPSTSRIPDRPTDNFLKERLIKDLGEKEICFDFMVQFQTDEVKMPIENPTVAWSSSFEKVATLKIKKQVFDHPAQENYGENLSFTPWHCLKAHRPLGGVNRARKIVYEKIARFRRSKNDAPMAEPDKIIDF
ncbi:MAG: catalase family protein [Flammeovirgaceae bacterium]|nr:catalase family protein [Flammeovirgaceae bacterium]